MTKKIRKNFINSTVYRTFTKSVLTPLISVSFLPIALSTISTGFVNGNSDKTSSVISYEPNLGRAVTRKPQKKPDPFIKILRIIEGLYRLLIGDFDEATSLLGRAFGFLRNKDFSSVKQKAEEVWDTLGRIESRISDVESQVDRLPTGHNRKLYYLHKLIDARLRVAELKLSVARLEFEFKNAEYD